jgi:hypothetical protein
MPWSIKYDNDITTIITTRIYSDNLNNHMHNQELKSPCSILYVWGPHRSMSYIEDMAIQMDFNLYRACTLSPQVRTIQHGPNIGDTQPWPISANRPPTIKPDHSQSPNQSSHPFGRHQNIQRDYPMPCPYRVEWLYETRLGEMSTQPRSLILNKLAYSSLSPR